MTYDHLILIKPNYVQITLIFIDTGGILIVELEDRENIGRSFEKFNLNFKNTLNSLFGENRARNTSTAFNFYNQQGI